MKKSSLLFTGILTFTGIIYNSWPLGYLLDKATARSGIASDLEDPNHPYAWVFITFDIITALILVGVSFYLYKNKPKLRSSFIRLAWLALCLGLLVFGFFTGFGAAAPDKCTGFGAACVNVFNKRFSVDGIETSLAGLGLLLALLSSACLSYLHAKRHQLVYWLTFIVYFITGSLLVHKIELNQNVHFLEQIFLILCGIGLASIGWNIDKIYKKKT
jgi:hypothetical membrane protein